MYLTIKNWITERPYSLLLTYWIFYLIYFIVLEAITVPKFILHASIDDYIPFMEIFIIPYALWFPMLVVSQAYFLFTKKKTQFQNLCFLMFTGMSISLLIYTFLPNGLNLRVTTYPDTFLGNIVSMLQNVDSPTNVCPSIHVSSTLAICLATIRCKDFRFSKSIKTSTVIITVLILLSTMFLKQHSMIDVIAGICLTLLLYPITYHTNWRKLFRHTPLKQAVN